MDQNRIPYPGGFFPGDQVNVVDGTFVGMPGKVVTPEEAKAIGGEASVLSRPKGLVWVVVTIYGRPVSVLLQPFQIKRAGGEGQSES
jgi:transcription antitermination factor NusG